MIPPSTRRIFLQQSLALGASLPAFRWNPKPAHPLRASGRDKLNLGIIGVAGRGADNLGEVAAENIVALCDIDRNRLAGARAGFPGAAAYEDYRELLQRNDLDAVVVSTPDHTHAIPVVTALRKGLHVYCEKPLAHSVHEARTIREIASRKKLVTQMGTQIHAGDNYRRVVELVKSGAVGRIARVHVWQGSAFPNSGVRVKDAKAPPHVNYDLWLGPAPERPFHESHFHFQWRYWWDFGGGVLADFGCHYMDLPHWALDLTQPTRIEARGLKEYQGDNDVPSSMRVDYQYPARGEQPPVHLTWYHGHWISDFNGFKAGVLFEGEGGMILADYGSHRLFVSDERGAVARPAATIAPSIGHHREWLEAIRSKGETTCNFEYAGNLTECVHLGNAAYRSDTILEWSASDGRMTNTRAADPFLRREYRSGWTLQESDT